jgi:hypothetical protein
MTSDPAGGFRQALTLIDTGETDLIVTMVAEAADWAREHGYRVVEAEQNGEPIFEIWPGDSGAPGDAQAG